jgi:hypothetical protein
VRAAIARIYKKQGVGRNAEDWPRHSLHENFRWSRFKHLPPAEMYTGGGEFVLPLLPTLGGDESAYAHRMKDAHKWTN